MSALADLRGTAPEFFEDTATSGADNETKRCAAAQIRAAQERGQPIAHIGWHHGLFEFAGRLTTPLPSITFAQVHEWCIAHPDGLLMTFNGKYPIPVAPFYVQDYRFGHIWIWRASDMLAAHIAEKAPANPMDDKDDDDTQ